jgi:hypothetical protein
MEDDEYNFDWKEYFNGNVQAECRTDNKESTISIHDIEAEKKCEFIQLNDETNAVKLAISEGFTSQWERLHGLSTSPSTLPITTMDETTNTLAPTVSNNDVFVISLLGDSTDGKSFLIDHLLPPIEKNRPIVVDETKRVGSTTANVTCFESASFLPEFSQTNTLLLDYEGEKGSHLPYLLQHMNEQCTPERAEKRRKAVSEYFPKLAYIISNVIIFLSRDDFTKNDYISRCYDFAERATRKLQQNPYKPVLIMVHNYSSHSLLQPITDVTREFFKTHLRDETKKLGSFFEAVYCMRLPYKMCETTNMTNMNEMFQKQLTDLKNLLTCIYKNHKKERTLPHIAWLDITRHVVDIVSNDGTVMMHMLLRQVLVKDPGNIELNTALFLFNILYKKRDIHSIRWFRFCRNFTISILARAIAIRFLHSMKYIPKSNLKNMIIREEARVCLEKLWACLDELRPCTALYMGQGYPTEENYPVFCLQHKGVHHEHRTSIEVHGIPLFSTSFLKIPRLGSTHDVWSGEFEYDDLNQDKPSQEIQDKFFVEICSYIEEIDNSADALYITLDRLLNQYDVNIDRRCVINCGTCCFCFQTTKLNRQTQMNNANASNVVPYCNSAICFECHDKRSTLLRENPVQRLLPPEDNKDKCVICMDAPKLIMLDPCYHQHFCKPCAERIYEQLRQCPLCRVNIVKLITPK